MNTSSVCALCWMFFVSYFTYLPCVDSGVHAAERKWQFFANHKLGEVHQVEMSVSVEGKLKVKPMAAGDVIDLPLSVAGRLVYDERWVQGTNLLTLRYYKTAEAKIQVGQRESTRFLRQNRRLVGFGGNDFYSPWGPLTRNELEIVNVQANTALLPELLPKKPVEMHEKWAPESAILARLLVLDVVSESDVTCVLAEVGNGKAVVRLQGSVDAAIGGIASRVELDGRFTYDLKAQHIEKMSLRLQEKRAIAHAAPGLDVTANLEISISPKSNSAELVDATVQRIKRKNAVDHLRLSFRSAFGNFELWHNRSWQMVTDTPDVSIFRLVDGGELIAQCNISRLDAGGGRQLSLEEFQEDVRRALGDRFGQFIEARESTTNTGLRILRVIAAGKVSELSLQWIYYHVEDDHGSRMSMVYTMEQHLVDRFGESDRSMAASLQMRPLQERDNSLPAKPNEN